MGHGGLESMLMNYYRNIDRSQIQFDFVVHRDFEADYDQEILALGGKIFRISKLIPWCSHYRNELKAIFINHPEYKIVHVHQDCLSSVALQCAKECGVPIRIAHSHNSNQDKNLKYLVKLYYRRQIPKYATYLFACGIEAGKWMYQGKPFHILKNAIDVSKYQYNEETAKTVRCEFDIEENELLIGHVGRFRKQKNHLYILEIFAELIKKGFHAKLILVGDGEEETHIREKAQELKIANHVIFAGSRNDVNRIMQAMDVFVFPSLYEGLPLTLIEAQAAGIPCVISDRISSECMILKQRISVMSLSDQPNKWADEIIRMNQLGKTDSVKDIQNAGYDIKKEAKKLERFYKSYYRKLM